MSTGQTHSASPTISTGCSLRVSTQPGRRRAKDLLRTLFLKVNVLNKVLAEDRFWTTINSLIRVDNLKPGAYFAREDVENALVDAWRPLTEAFGARQLLSELKSRMNAVDLTRLLARVYDKDIPAKIRRLKQPKLFTRKLKKWVQG